MSSNQLIVWSVNNKLEDVQRELQRRQPDWLAARLYADELCMRCRSLSLALDAAADAVHDAVARRDPEACSIAIERLSHSLSKL